MKKFTIAGICATTLLLTALAGPTIFRSGAGELRAVDTSAMSEPDATCECVRKPGYIGSTMNETCDFHSKANRTGSMFARGYVLYDMHENGHYMVLFHRTPDYGRDQYCSVVLDMISIPHTAIPKDHIAVGQQCRYDDVHDPEIFVLAPAEEADLKGTDNAWRAWRANRRTGKIEEVDATRVYCPPCIGLFCV